MNYHLSYSPDISRRYIAITDSTDDVRRQCLDTVDMKKGKNSEKLNKKIKASCRNYNTSCRRYLTNNST